MGIARNTDVSNKGSEEDSTSTEAVSTSATSASAASPNTTSSTSCECVVLNNRPYEIYKRDRDRSGNDVLWFLNEHGLRVKHYIKVDDVYVTAEPSQEPSPHRGGRR